MSQVLVRVLPQSEWLASGEGAARNKVDMPDHVKEILAQPNAPVVDYGSF